MKLVEVFNRKQINSIIRSGLHLDLGVGFIHTMNRYLEEYRTDDDIWIVYMLYNNGKPAGVCGLYNNTRGKCDELWVGWLGIYPKYRNHRLGSKMLTELKKKARHLGADTLLLYCNQKRISFYQNNNFDVISDKRMINRFVRECYGTEEFARKGWSGAIMKTSLC